MSDIRLSARAAKLARQVDEIAASHLGGPGRVRIAVRVNLQGLVTATAAGVIGGPAALLAGSSKLEASTEGMAELGFPTDAQQAIGLTDDALVVVSRSQLSGKPKSFRCTIPLRAVAAAHFEKARLGDKIRFEMTSGALVDFVCVKVDPGEEFAAAVTRGAGRPSGDMR